jgi:signal transduction histidine kinase
MENDNAIRRGGYNARYAASLTATACLGLTVLALVGPELDPTIGSRRLHVAIETAAAMVLILVAAVLLGRFRLNGSRRTLLKLAAVIVLVLDNLASAIFTITVDQVSSSGFSTWAFAAHGVLGSFLLLLAAVLPDRLVRQRKREMVLIVGISVALFAAITAVIAVLGSRLPGAFQEPPLTAEQLQVLGEHPTLVAVEIVTALFYGGAAVALARLAEAQEDDFLKWFAIGLVIAAMAYLNYALFPSQFTELLYLGDLLFLGTIGALLFAAVREISREEAAMIRSAVLQERRRVARDLHDGVAQELAFIASQTRWFMRDPANLQPLPEILDAVERALDESRSAIAALDRPIDESLDRALEHAAIDVANRVGARVHLDLDGHVDVTPDWRDALLRITREAIGNAVRHGQARTISLQLRNADVIRLRVSDDGEGFDTSAPRSPQSFGLTSMRERTESLGGEFSIASTPGGGTTVEVALP